MRSIILTMFCALFLGINVPGQQGLTQVSSDKRIVKETEVARLEKDQTAGTKSKTTLTFTGTDVRMVAVTGPEDDMLSYRIQGLRNPTIVVPSGATVRVLFINTDGDMKHDIRFGTLPAIVPLAPETTGTAGTERLLAMAEDKTFQADEVVLKAVKDGSYKYFCSVKGHAKGGMWGNLLVNIKPGTEKMPIEGNGDDMKDMPGMTMKGDKAKPDDRQPDDTAGTDEDGEKSTDAKTDAKKSDDMAGMNMGGDKGADKSGDGKRDDKKTDGMAGMNMSGAGKAARPESVDGMDKDTEKMKMSSAIDINTPMVREGTGTAWAPDTSPLFGKMKMLAGGGMLMVHGNMFFRYTNVSSGRSLSVGGRGDTGRPDAPSMLMVMYTKPLSERSQFGIHAMFSLDPLLEKGYGYPLLYQSGEAYKGQPIHDRQHPHDLFSELAAAYSYRLSDKTSLYFYAGLPGEPALGPVAFMHRASASNNPDAPLGHHWQDATHITFGVLTAGVNFGRFKLEASAFKGREPDESRWNFDKPKLDSYSGRLSWNPNKQWSFQVSHGMLKNPEPGEPDLKLLHRTTASAMYNEKIGDYKNWASTFVWGQNNGNAQRSNAFLLESNYDFYDNAVYGRFERVQKNGRELALTAVHPAGNFWVGGLTGGYVREVYKDKNWDVGIGAQATWNTNPQVLSPVYGGTNHGAFQIYMRVRGSKVKL
jgi:Sulfocyanin (SoxE) domain